ncbi:uncharacterized protein LOC135693945 [Rhopilema esculentum]|uniref:uncharacterized protein LOC135693945 n=1 Tax=Rhopilema esculentum TaxID=499914 RepID=UPI0031DA32E7
MMEGQLSVVEGSTRPKPVVSSPDEEYQEEMYKQEGWIKSLRLMPNFDTMKLNDKLIGSLAMSRSKAPKAYRNKTQGYKLWKEGYVRCVFVKPNLIQNDNTLFLVRVRVYASMKTNSYKVYAHLDQDKGDVIFAKCDCKAGQGGCCKHAAALLYTLVDYVNMDLQDVPQELTCTQVGQKWQIPSSVNGLSKKAFKFDFLVFEKAEEGKKRKKPCPSGERNYCATPPVAYKTNQEELVDLVNCLEIAGKKNLFCKAVKSNSFVPCEFFETSCSKAISKKVLKGKEDEENSSLIYIERLFEGMSTKEPSSSSLATYAEIVSRVGITFDAGITLCKNTLKQNEEQIWHTERAKRITSSIFGRVMNRRKTIYPASIVKTIIEKKEHRSGLPLSLRWGLEKESDAKLLYQEQLGDELIVEKCGLVVNPMWPWLGCSPDGLIVVSGKPIGALEVKCPYSKRNMLLTEAIKDDTNFFLIETGGKLLLKKTHGYYFQCQGVLNLLNLDWINFFVYTSIDFHVERIERDESLWSSKMLPTLTSFFTEFILPKLEN